MVNLNISLPDDIAALLERQAMQRHESPDALIAQALRQLLENMGYESGENSLFARFVQDTLTEWDSAEDNEAFRDL
jgi:predicted transcriptional regulator